MNEQTRTITSNFVRELEDAQNKKQTSLPFIIHTLPKTPIVKDGETFLVLKIGGSILQKSRVKIIGNTLTVLTLEESKLPVMASKDIFLSVIDRAIDRDIQTLAINFAYPINPVFEHGKLDGILTMGCKEHAFLGLIEQTVGATIEQFMKSKYDRTIKVSVANDTICLTLAGLTEYSAQSIAGGVVGTGLNFALFLDDTHVVNLEAAYFDKFDQSEEGKQIDMQSLNRGKALFEKETSGGYLYLHLNFLLAKQKINHPAITSTKQLDHLSRGNVEAVSVLAKQLFEHSASMVASEIAGIAEFKKRDMVFIMEGSLFWIGWHYRKMVEEYVKKLTNYSITFVEIKDCGIIGASKLVT